MSATPPEFSLDSLFSWLSWLWSVFVPAVVLTLGTTVGTAVISWIFSRIHDVTEAVDNIISNLRPRV